MAHAEGADVVEDVAARGVRTAHRAAAVRYDGKAELLALGPNLVVVVLRVHGEQFGPDLHPAEEEVLTVVIAHGPGHTEAEDGGLVPDALGVLQLLDRHLRRV